MTYIAAGMSKPDGPGDGWGGMNAAWSIIGTLFAGMIAWGLIGWGLDRVTGARLFLPFGILIGLGGALYLVVKRYGGG